MCKQSRKIFNNKNSWTYFLRIFNANYMGFDNRENKHALYLDKIVRKKFYTSLKEHATNANNFEKKKILPLTKKS